MSQKVQQMTAAGSVATGHTPGNTAKQLLFRHANRGPSSCWTSHSCRTEGVGRSRDKLMKWQERGYTRGVAGHIWCTFPVAASSRARRTPSYAAEHTNMKMNTNKNTLSLRTRRGPIESMSGCAGPGVRMSGRPGCHAAKPCRLTWENYVILFIEFFRNNDLHL